jgi:hypothetical protein
MRKNQWKYEKREDQNQYGWMKLMETLGYWVYDCGGEELQVLRVEETPIGNQESS